MNIFYSVTTSTMSCLSKFSISMISLQLNNFNSLNSSEMWPENSIRNGNYSNYCNYKKGLVFGIDENEKSVNTVSRGLLTNPYKLFQSTNKHIQQDCFISPPSSTYPTLEQQIVNEVCLTFYCQNIILFSCEFIRLS